MGRLSSLKKFFKAKTAADFQLAAYKLTKQKFAFACKVTILLWAITTPLDLILVSDRLQYFIPIRLAVIIAASVLLFINRSGDGQKSYKLTIILFSSITLAFMGFAHLYPEGLEVINQALLSFVLLFGLSVVWPARYTFFMGFVIVSSSLTLQYIDTGFSQKLFIDTVYLYSAMFVATIITQLNFNLEAKNFETNRQLEHFAYNIAHDLKAPLRAIKSYSQFLVESLEENDEAAAKDYAVKLKNRAIKGESLINGVLAYASAGGKLEFSEVDIDALLQRILEGFRVTDAATEFITSEYPTRIRTSSIAIEQVFTNLIANAIKHNTKPQRTIKTSHRLKDRFHHFSIEDNGPGIAIEHQKKMFDVFSTFNAQSSNSQGLGLAIVQKLVMNLGGKISVSSVLDQGTTFTFTVPEEIQ